jgi:type IV secretion system protein VirD4
VPAIDMDLHLARVQQRWRYANDELAPTERLNVDALAHDLHQLPAEFEKGTPEDTADILVRFFGEDPKTGGAVEPTPDHDGVLIDEPAAAEP